MKRIINLVILLLLVMIPISVFASGNVSVSTTSLNVNLNGSSTFKIIANNSAGKVNITSSDTSIATVSSSSEFVDMGSVTITVKGLKEGNATITIYNEDVTTYDDEDISGQSKTINVTVKKASSNNTSNSSKNNKLESISVTGYELNKVNDNKYELTVNYNVENIEINANAEDSKATITGTGKKDLEVGENKFEIVVKSQSGSKNKINVIITRKDDNYLSDIDEILKQEDKEISITLKDEETISKEILSKIKNSKKIITINKYDEDKTLLYGFIIDGNKLDKEIDINTNISFNTDKKDKIDELSNYADGIYINIGNNSLSNGIKLKINISNKYKDKNILKLYYYNENKDKIELVKDNISSKDGIIELELSNKSNYFITRSDINGKTPKIVMLIIVSIIEFLLILVAGILYYLRNEGLIRLDL